MTFIKSFIVAREKDPLNKGYVLEEEMYKSLLELGFEEVKHERDLTRHYGWLLSSIDFLIEVDNCMIAIQTKYKKTRRRENHGIDNFLRSLDHFQKVVGNNKQLLGLWISRLEPFEDNLERLAKKNVYCISCFESIEQLVSKTKCYLKELRSVP